MRDYNKSRDLLLSNSKEVNIMGDLIAMNMSVVIFLLFYFIKLEVNNFLLFKTEGRKYNALWPRVSIK